MYCSPTTGALAGIRCRTKTPDAAAAVPGVKKSRRS